MLRCVCSLDSFCKSIAHLLILQAVEACLDHYNVSYDASTNFEYDSDQSGVLSRLSDPNGTDFGSLWSPALFTFLDSNEGSGVICNGTTAGVNVPGGIFVSKISSLPPEIIALALAGWLKGIKYMFDPRYRQQSMRYANELYVGQGMSALTQQAMDLEFARTFYDLKGQLDMMAKKDDGVSTLGSWLGVFSNQMYASGVLVQPLSADSHSKFRLHLPSYPRLFIFLDHFFSHDTTHPS